MEDDWDLQAVVRGCASTTTTASNTSAVTTTTCTATDSSASASGQIFSSFQQDCDFSAGWLQDLYQPRREKFVEELHDLYKPFFPRPQQQSSPSLLTISPQSLPLSPLSVLGGLQDLSSEQQQQPQIVQRLPQRTQFPLKQQPFSVVNGSKAASASHTTPTPRSKKRKNHLKRICHVPAESLSSDMWSWRKYGQKPIKGSPYPRGYYRCSTSKGCMARKQVERNRSDPGMFIVTYTAEHNHPMPTHRNSLAGSTRQKPGETPNSSDDSKKPSPAETSSPVPEKVESSREELGEADQDDDEEDGFSAGNMVVDEDFFAGLEDFTCRDGGECVSDNFPANFEFPWLASSATTTTSTAAGGG